MGSKTEDQQPRRLTFHLCLYVGTLGHEGDLGGSKRPGSYRVITDITGMSDCE